MSTKWDVLTIIYLSNYDVTFFDFGMVFMVNYGTNTKIYYWGK